MDSKDVKPGIWEGINIVDAPPPRRPMGFFTDSTLCIGCKACEVACKQWNGLPADNVEWSGQSYDNTRSLSATTWRHVTFTELALPAATQSSKIQDEGRDTQDSVKWLFNSDVCKHCSAAPCQEVCPTGALIRNEFDDVYLQQDVCNGCGYCVAACPFGVIERREDERDDKRGGGVVSNVGVAQKCTLCYDRLGHDQTPACAQACPTTSIKFGTLAEMLDTARDRVEVLHDNGFTEARLYGANSHDGVGGTGSVFLLLDEPEVYGLPPDPQVPTADLPDMFR